jgi:hypothetical protein
MTRITIASALLIATIHLNGQSLLDELPDENTSENKEEVTSLFKSNRILLGHSVKNVNKGDLNFAVMHNFGAINTGFKEFYGLDGANTALNFDYGISDALNVGYGRSTYEKTFQGYLKQQVLQQSNRMPVALTLFASTYVYGMDWPEGESAFTNAHRLSYVTQLLVARKFTQGFTMQLSPTFIHKNLVKKTEDNNNIMIIAGGARLKLSQRTSISTEFSYVLPNQIASDYKNFLGFGINFDTGGHVFQLRLSNTTSLYETSYMTTSQSSWLDGDIHFGFTINRRFTLIK